MRNFLFFIIFISAMPSFSAVYLKVVYIADSTVNCGINKCLLTRDSPTENYKVFDKTIEGFSYQEGFEYCLLIEIQTPGITETSVPSDSSQIKYVLKEIKSKIKTKGVLTKSAINIPDSSKWILYKLKMKEEMRTFSITKAFIQFNTNNNTLSGSTDCNGFFGNYSNDSVFKFLNINSTLLACKRSVETEFLSALNKTNRIKITSKLLYLYCDKKLLALFTRKK